MKFQPGLEQHHGKNKVSRLPNDHSLHGLCQSSLKHLMFVTDDYNAARLATLLRRSSLLQTSQDLDNLSEHQNIVLVRKQKLRRWGQRQSQQLHQSR